MKKWRGFHFVAAMMLALVVVLAGCGDKDAETSASVAPSTEPSSGVFTEPEAKIDSKTLDAIKKRGKLVAGVKFDTNLFGLKDPASGEVKGFDIDIAKLLAKKIFGDETKLELKEVTSKTRIPLLQNGEIDLIIATMTITEERKQQVEFSDVYFMAGQSILVKKGSPLKSVTDLKKGDKVLAVKGSTSAQNIREKAPDATVLEFENYQDAFTALKAGQGVALTTDNAILFGMMKQDAGYEVVGDTFTDEPYGIAVPKGDTAFAGYVTELITDLKKAGDYARLYESWMGVKPTK
jgi:aspartate/glutamate/glutamine transport system substrate-binding protein